MYDSLLVPVDETAATTRLTERAIELADTWNATVHLVGVVDGPSAVRVEATGRDDRVSGARERARRASMRAAERARRAGVDAHRTVRRGIAHAEIVDETRRIDADLVLLGSPGRETTEGAVCSGQVARRVVDRTDCAVLVEQPDRDLTRGAHPTERVADESTTADAPATTSDEPMAEREDSTLVTGPQ